MIRSSRLCQEQGQDIAGQGQENKTGLGNRGRILKGSATKDKLFCLLLMNDSASTSGSTCTSIDVSDSQNPFSSPPSTKQTQVPTTLIWYFFH